MSSTAPTIHVLPSVPAVSAALDTLVASLSAAAIAARGTFTVAISGGSLPETLAAVLAKNPTVDFARWHVFLADERCVPLDHKDSNFRLVKQTLLDKLPAARAPPAANLHPLDPVLAVKDPASCAAQYARQLAAVFGGDPAAPDAGRHPPVFDLILLGIGPDGHTCSLFPDHPLLQEDSVWVAPITDSPKPPPTRITLTFPVLNAARSVVFVTTGDNKADVLVEILEDNKPLPARLVKPANGAIWYLDTGAASKLPQDFKSSI
ncbi:6-phosphogluconolactonase [Zopfochytrium polystomum]|nr:6-phosphogluconolactonase [Zopfochytrium polystomum]